MNYALGYSFTLKDMLITFPYRKLKTSSKQCESITGDYHRQSLFRRVFLESVKLIISDIIENNVTFWLPLTGRRKCNMHMKRTSGELFKKLRKCGKWKNVDIVKSMFSGYEIKLFMQGERTPRQKTVYLNKKYRDLIDKNTNEGMQYGDGACDKTIDDYYEAIQQLFPLVPKIDIQRILKFGWRAIYLHNSYGGDTLVMDRDIWFYIGKLKRNSLEHFFYYLRKLTIKLRVLYKRKKIEWDGYYYFALSDSQYEAYKAQQNKRGRRRKEFQFGAVFLYEILDECKINEYYRKYIFRVPFITRLKQKYFIRDFTSSQAELILVREPLKFKDIIVYDNEYEFI